MALDVGDIDKEETEVNTWENLGNDRDVKKVLRELKKDVEALKLLVFVRDVDY